MNETNLSRMLHLVDEVFSTRNDPAQLQVNEGVIEQLQKIHPATVSEYNEGNGPCIWILLIPTTTELMNLFIAGNISEQELFDRIQPNMKYEALYLCSAIALPEYRGKGIAKRICLEAIEKIRSLHPIGTLFVWPFTTEGNVLSEKLGAETGLPLKKREIKTRKK
ncbi:MAG: hypothetical protein NT126_01665 [Bacteroidetes bacterium]|nr:hypothetical protein [Bacteroidota bacterium]